MTIIRLRRYKKAQILEIVSRKFFIGFFKKNFFSKFFFKFFIKIFIGKMDRPWDDCRFFVTSGCRNANCKFRHSEAAKKNPTCPSWASGKCKDINCPRKVRASLIFHQSAKPIFSMLSTLGQPHVDLSSRLRDVPTQVAVSNILYLEIPILIFRKRFLAHFLGKYFIKSFIASFILGRTR